MWCVLAGRVSNYKKDSWENCSSRSFQNDSSGCWATLLLVGSQAMHSLGCLRCYQGICTFGSVDTGLSPYSPQPTDSIGCLKQGIYYLMQHLSHGKSCPGIFRWLGWDFEEISAVCSPGFKSSQPLLLNCKCGQRDQPTSLTPSTFLWSQFLWNIL